LISFSEQILRVKNGGTNIPAILVGNKIDLAERRKVTLEEAEQKARSWSIRYIETSAKTKHNVDKVKTKPNENKITVFFCSRFFVN
jgi:Ras-related protein Ral-A